jgi:hypothetical protein
MSKSFQLIVPTIAETETTGFLGAIEKRFRGALYRVEIWPSGLSCTKDGVKLRTWDDVPASIQRAAASGRAMLAEAAALRK